MSHVNNWSNPSEASAQDVADMAAALEERGRAFDQQQVNAALISVLAPTPDEHLLEVGCGSGLLCRLIAPAVAPAGKIAGLDISSEFVRIARDNAINAELSDSIQWGAGQAEALPFQEAKFDGVLAARLLLHVSNPQSVLCELVRVIRPGGRVVVMDWDFDTLALDHPNRELTRRLLHWRCDHHGGNNWSGRQLWGQMVSAGLTNVRVVPFVSVAHHEQDSLTLSLFRAAQVARDGGAIAPGEYDAWIGELRSSLAAGCFFASIVYFIVSGERKKEDTWDFQSELG
ncbi:MAG: methyltransferase domain-containing protein [Anaerolineales bacterium]